jgi:hypothetical protein
MKLQNIGAYFLKWFWFLISQFKWLLKDLQSDIESWKRYFSNTSYIKRGRNVCLMNIKNVAKF